MKILDTLLIVKICCCMFSG